MYRMGKEEMQELERVIASKQLFRSGDPAEGHQQEVVRFEREWSQTIGCRYTLCLSGGGTAALICGLVGLGIGPGDEVLVPSYTWMATALAVCAVGAIPVLVEVDETLSLDPLEIQTKWTPQTRAVIPVHMAGRPAAIDRIVELARERNMFVLEDCSQCDGGSYKGKRVGTWGDAGAFSFNDFKIISCGEGGALVTDNNEIYERALAYHDAGISFRHYGQSLNIPVFMGQQYRASELQGAVLRMQLQRLDGILHDLRRVRRVFEEAVAAIPALELAPSHDPDGDCGVVLALRFKDEKTARSLAERAKAAGFTGGLPIDSGKHVYTQWTPLLEHRVGHHPDVNPFNHPRNQGLRMDYKAAMCPRTLDLLSRTVKLGLQPDWTDGEITQRIEVLRQAAGKFEA